MTDWNRPCEGDADHEFIPPSAKEKVKALDLALQQIEKQFGKGAIMKLGEESREDRRSTIIPTGSIGLDMALGVGGVPRGRIVEIYGPESSGKTTLALTIIANAQRAGGNAVFIDAEHALDAAYAQKLGVDIANLHVAQPDTGEEALEIADHLVRSGAVDVVVIDSVAALVPRAEIEGEMGDSHVGLQARLMSQALRKLTGSISKSKTTRDLHQPDPHADRRHVRQSRDHRRRPRAQVLRLGAPRHPPHRDAQGRRRRRSATAPRSRW